MHTLWYWPDWIISLGYLNKAFIIFSFLFKFVILNELHAGFQASFNDLGWARWSIHKRKCQSLLRKYVLFSAERLVLWRLLLVTDFCFFVLQLSDIAVKLGYKDVSDLTPTEIAIEVCRALSLSLHYWSCSVKLNKPNQSSSGRWASSELSRKRRNNGDPGRRSIISQLFIYQANEAITHSQSIEQVESILDKEDLFSCWFKMLKTTNNTLF